MPDSSKKLVLGIAALLIVGAGIGAVYDQAERGLLIAALVILAWQIRQLLVFNSGLRTGDFEEFRDGDGIWQQMFSRFNYEYENARRYKREYRRVLKEIRKSTDAMPDGAIIINEQNEIVMCNRAAKSLTGLRRKKDRGQRIDNILRDPGLTNLLQSDDPSSDVEIASPVRDNAWLTCRVVPYGASQKLLILRDTTESIRLERMRRDFVANASHELRSPLTVITGYLDSLAEDRTLQSEWQQPISRMRENARRMNHIVAELLELSRLESAGSATTDEIVDIPGLLSAAANSCEGQEDIAAVSVSVESSAQLLGRSNEIESLISNLLSNAIRHTPPDGRITMIWRPYEKGAELVVNDSGEGIAADQIPRLTERFFRVDRGRAREDGGVGLGLAIVKHILNRHDGILEVESEPGKGSEFSCQFSAERLYSEPPAPIQSGDRA